MTATATTTFFARINNPSPYRPPHQRRRTWACPIVVMALVMMTGTFGALGCKKSSSNENGNATPTARGLALSPDFAWLGKAGESATIAAFVTFTDDSRQVATNVTWQTSDANVATVVDGIVTATGPGEATITATVGALNRTAVVCVGADWFVVSGFSGGGNSVDLLAVHSSDLSSTATGLKLGGGTFFGGAPFLGFFDGYLFAIGNHGPTELTDTFATYADGYIVTDAANTRWSAYSDAGSMDALIATNRLAIKGGHATDIAAPLASGPFAVGNSTVLYARFRLDVLSAPTMAVPFAHLASSTPVARIFAAPGTTAGTFKVGIANSGTAPQEMWATDLNENTTYTVVVRYDVDAATTTLWIDPTADTDTHIDDTTASAAVAVADFAWEQHPDLGAAELAVFGLQVAQDFSTALGRGFDTISKIDPATQSIVAELELDVELHEVRSAASAQEIAFYSATRAYIAHLNPDTAGDYYVTIFNPQTMAVTGKISLPNPTGDPLYSQGIAVFHHLVFVVNTALDLGTLTYSTGTVTVIDGETGDVIDVDTGTAGVQFLALDSINARRATISPTGQLYVLASGNASGFVSPQDSAKLAIFDPLTFERKALLDFAAGAVGGSQIGWTPNGRLYFGSQEFGQPDVFSVDGLTDSIVRDAANPARVAIGGTPETAGYWSSLNVTPEGRVLLGNQGTSNVYAFASDDDADLGDVDGEKVATSGSPGSSALWRPDPPLIFADTVVDYVNPAANFNDPNLALGAPLGSGSTVASADVVEIGPNGRLTLKFSTHRIVDRPGPDFVIFGAATYTQPTGDFRHLTRTMTPGTVEVSADGKTWHPFPTNLNHAFATTHPRRFATGFFGLTPTWSRPDNGIHPASWAAGGDRFDLADVGLTHAKYIRLTGSGAQIDAIAALHAEQD